MTSSETTSNSTTSGSWDPVRLSNAHVYMIEQHVRGVSLRRIQTNLKRFGQHYSGGHIRKILASPRGQEYSSLVSALVHGGPNGLAARGAELLPEAVHTQLGIMRDPLAGERHRLGAAQDFMDRVGLPKISRQESENHPPQVIVINLTPAQQALWLAPPAVMESEVVMLPELPSSTDEGP